MYIQPAEAFKYLPIIDSKGKKTERVIQKFPQYSSIPRSASSSPVEPRRKDLALKRVLERNGKRGIQLSYFVDRNVPRVTRRFKLDLRPPSLRIDTPRVNLPPGRTVIDVFGDFLKYMFNCVQDHIINTHVDGNRKWTSLKGTAHFILR